ncbi:ADP,ATP carrier protein ER-ANT1 [Populus alba x Populus x berolinensis]|uniref:ADP/ATP translocase n=1 Tax=Populus alba x Populus x berolinensis TaxID=444605 RepID=A0AAD6Q494_9ROSI|nr:ADP,ATP carrier protein ER-ANT1 [Populus alba x Populus x berolinensis]
MIEKFPNSEVTGPEERRGEEMGAKSKSEKFSAEFVIGGAAAIVSKSAAAPIERVKLLLQNQGEMIKRGQLKTPYTGVRDCFKRVFREEGLFSFWRGNQANIIRYFPYSDIKDNVETFLTTKPNILLTLLYCHRAHLAFNFAFKGYFKGLIGCSKEKDGYIKWFTANVASGSAAGATTSLFLYHLDYARTRLGTDSRECPINGQHQFRGLFDVYRKTLSSDGILGLYRDLGFQ